MSTPRKMACPASRFGISRALILVLASILILEDPVEGQKRPVRAEDYYHLVSVGEVAMNPRGDAVAFTVTRIQEEENDRRRSVWIRLVEEGRPVGEAYRFTSPVFDASSPKWSPDGGILSFTSRRGDDPNPFWFAPVREVGREAYHVEGVRGTPYWSPDGTQIAFVAGPEESVTLDPEEGSQGSSRKGWVSPDAVSKGADAARFDGRVITHLNYKRDGVFSPLPHPSAQERPQLYLVPSAGGVATQLTDLPFSIRELVWAPDGNRLYFTGDETEGDDMDFGFGVQVFVLPLAAGSPQALTEGRGRRSSLTLSPQGAELTFLFSRGYGEPTDLLVMDLSLEGSPTGVPRNLTENWDLSPTSPHWTADGRSLRFIAQKGGNRHLFQIPAGGGQVRPVTEGDRVLGTPSASTGGNWMAYTAESPVRPAEVLLAKGDGAGEVRLTSFNDDWIDQLLLSDPRRHTWEARDGTMIEGWILPPAQGGPDPHPMVLNIHGGPHAAYGNRFSLPFQMLAGSGFYVFYLNPRGSTGYGHGFTWDIWEGWGEKDEEDFVTGIEAMLEAYPNIDADRLGVTGWSYGGFMTNWLTARTDLFAAAVTGASIADWESDAGTTDLWWTIFNEFGPLWEAREVYRRLSPLSYVEHVSAPTLILHGEHDVRVPYKNAEQWFRALKMRGIPTELVRYPRSAHGIREPWLAVDRLARTRSWLLHWLADEDGEGEGR